MDVVSVNACISRLRLPSDAATLSAKVLAANFRIGLLADGAPAIFFVLDGCRTESAQRFTGALQIETSSEFRVEIGKSRQKVCGFLLVLRDANLRWCFAALVAEIWARLDQDPFALDSIEKIEHHVDNWAKLFSESAMPSEAAIGLWGELYFLSQFPDVDRGVMVWAGPFGDPYDFSGGRSRVEIKTCVRRFDAWFSLKQLSDKDEGHSVFIRALNDRHVGRNIDDLVVELERRLQRKQAFQLALLRVGYRPGTARDLRLVVEEMKVVKNLDIPRPAHQDVRIKQVRFQLDVETLPTAKLGPEELIVSLARSNGASAKR